MARLTYALVAVVLSLVVAVPAAKVLVLANASPLDPDVVPAPRAEAGNCTGCNPGPCQPCESQFPVCCYATNQYAACCGEGDICCGTSPFGWCCNGRNEKCGTVAGTCERSTGKPTPAPPATPAPPPPCSNACDLTVCDLAACPTFSPYLCEEGALAGSCNPSGATLNATGECSACCDTAKCPPKTPKPHPHTPHPVPPTPKPHPPTPKPHPPTPHPVPPTPKPHPPTPKPHPPTPKPPVPTPVPQPTGIPTPVPGSFCGGKCNTYVCTNLKRCNYTEPFQCTMGPDVWQCTADANKWDAKKQCWQCCDTRSCEFSCTKKCPAEMCKYRRPGCSKEAKWMCTSGQEWAYCSADKDHWPETKGCDSCCDIDTCPPV